MPECKHGHDVFSASPCEQCVAELEVTAAVNGATGPLFDIPDCCRRDLWPEQDQLELEAKRKAALDKMDDGQTVETNVPSVRSMYPLTDADKKTIAELTEFHNKSVKEKAYERLSKAGFV